MPLFIKTEKGTFLENLLNRVFFFANANTESCFSLVDERKGKGRKKKESKRKKRRKNFRRLTGWTNARFGDDLVRTNDSVDSPSVVVPISVVVVIIVVVVSDNLVGGTA